MPITARCQNSLENQGSRSCLIEFILHGWPDGHGVWAQSGKNRAAHGGFADRRTPTPAGKGPAGIAMGVTVEARPGMGEHMLPGRGSRDIVAQVRNAILARPMRAAGDGAKVRTACRRLCAAWRRLPCSYGMFLPAAGFGARPSADAAGETDAGCLLPRVSGRRRSVRR